MLREYGLAPVQAVAAKNGKAVVGDIEIAFTGACDTRLPIARAGYTSFEGYGA